MSVSLSFGRLALPRQVIPLLVRTPPSTFRSTPASLVRSVQIPTGDRRHFSPSIIHLARSQHIPLPRPHPLDKRHTDDPKWEQVEVRPRDFVNEVFPDPKAPQFLAPLLYTVLFGIGTYIVAATVCVNQSEAASQAVDADRNPFGNVLSYVRNVQEADLPGGRRESQLHAYTQHLRAEKFGRWIRRAVGVCDTLGFSRQSKKDVAKLLTDAAEWYLNLPPRKQVVVPALGTIGATFIVLNIGFLTAGPSLRRSLFRLVMHVPVSRNHVALTLSALTHLGIFHLALNSYALWNFDGSSLRASRFVKDQQGRVQHTAEASLLPHYVAFFLISGTFAALCAHGEAFLMFRVIQRRAGRPKAMRLVGLLPAVGSSGAAYALVTNWALCHRDEGLMGVIFLPTSWMQKPLEMLTFILSAELIVTVLGFLRGRRLTSVGHVAHLGGALFGWLYHHFGNGAWEQTKARVPRIFHANRSQAEPVVHADGRDAVVVRRV